MGKLAEKKVDGVFTIWEARALVKELGLEKAMGKITAVTTGTFEPIEAVSLFFQIQEVFPKIKFGKLSLNEVEAYPHGKEGGGILSASVVGQKEDHGYSGAHVVEDLVRGKKVRIRAQGQLTDLFSRKELDDLVDLKTLKSAEVEITISRELKGSGIINSSGKSIICDLGALLPDYGNINYSGCGDISPFSYKGLMANLKMGTPVFLGGAIGNISSKGMDEITLRADLRGMNSDYLRAGSFGKSGSTLYLGIGVTFVIKSPEELAELLKENETLLIDVFDIGKSVEPEKSCGQFSFYELNQGSVIFQGKETRTAHTASSFKAREIAMALKERIERGEFPLCQKQE